MKTSEDFLLLVLHGHVVVAANVILTKNPATSLADLAKAIVYDFVILHELHLTKGTKYMDRVHLYAMELLTLSLLWHGFYDACKEGDGERILCYWKFLLIIFKSAGNHPHYAKEAVILFLQYYYVFSERKKAQLLWSRCINTKGYAGANMPCDLFNEHLNRRLKTVLRAMGPNVNLKSVVKAGKAIAPVQHVCQAFEQQTCSSMHSDHHSFPSFGKDLTTIVNVLTEEKVFTPIGQREHASFKFKHSLLEKLTKDELITRIKTNIEQVNICL